MSGGKGGSQTSKVQIPKEFLDPAVRNINRAEQMASMGYQPYYGPEVAAFTPLQEQAMQSQYNAAAAFGMVPQGGNALAGIPQATEYAGGIRGYGSGDLFEQSINEFQKRQPAQAAIYNSLFVGPDGDYSPPRDPGRPVMSGGVGDGGMVSPGSIGATNQQDINNMVTDFNTGTGSFAGGGMPSMGPSVGDLMQNTNNMGMPPSVGPYVVNTYTDIPGVGAPNVFPGGITGASGGGSLPGAPVSYPEGIPGDFPGGIPTTPSPGGEPVDSTDAAIDFFNQNQFTGNNISGGFTGMPSVDYSKAPSIDYSALPTFDKSSLMSPAVDKSFLNQGQVGYFKPNRGLFGMIGA